MLGISLYTFSVAIHVVVVVVAFGSSFSFPVLGGMAKKAPQHAIFALNAMRFIQERLIIPGLLIVLATGVYQSIEGPYKMGEDLWLDLSVGLFTLMILAILFITYPGTKKAQAEITKGTQTGGPFVPTPAFLSAVKRNSILGPVLGLGTITITFLMEAKPF